LNQSLKQRPLFFLILTIQRLHNKLMAFYLLIANYVKKENNHNNYIEENNNKIIDALLFLIGACNHLNLSIFYSSSIKS